MTEVPTMEGLLRRGSIQRGSIQRGSIQRGSIQRGSIQRGSIQLLDDLPKTATGKILRREPRALNA